ncbi:hypothetical protein [Paraburkholderia antibiotica]|uniref:Uncharacterized protein n=1 Tax=Paraburkholderia antibiotica TaxID=2728839 RepID=A0A7Y0A0J2_9BURK|nr:hypothetical protein [Paraburkholderia antibiotica]NML34244.1 hypothetical protein [Paraburkholderia antibiotica]
MPKFACQCGYVTNLSVTSDSEWVLVPEKTTQDIGEAMDEGKVVDGEYFYEMLRGKEITVYRCPSCGRLHLEEAGRNKFVTYIKEPSA